MDSIGAAVVAVILIPLIMGGVLLTSGVAKLHRPDDIMGWSTLGVPAAFRKPWLLRLHPWAEIALAVALISLGGLLGLLAGLVSVVLMLVYLLLVVKAVRSAPDATCSCFGARRPVTRVTIARNVWLTLLAVATTAVIWTTPLWGGVVVSFQLESAWGWAIAAGIAVLTAVVIVWPDPTDAGAEAAGLVPSSSSIAPAHAGEDAEYVRVRTPAVPVTLADGSIVNLPSLAARRPVLLLAVSPTCSSCLPVIDSAAEWRTSMSELDVRLLVRSSPVPGSFMESDEPQSLHDPEGYVSGSIADWATPTAVLLGADGLLAGGPVTGAAAIDEFVAEIRAALDESAESIGTASPP